MGIQFSGGAAATNNRVPPGLYRFADRRTGAVLAEVTSNGTYTVNANALSNAGQVVRSANLPHGQIVPRALWTNAGRVANEHRDEIMERFSVTKRIRAMTFTERGLHAPSTSEVEERPGTFKRPHLYGHRSGLKPALRRE